jgi:deoxyadenosine/deoxycytidine kinase
MNEIIVLSIEGNIGGGKSTLLQELRKKYTNDEKDDVFVYFLKEPVDEWEKIKDEAGVTMLENFYKDPKKYAFPFQMMAYVSRLKVFRDMLKHVKKLNILNKKIVFVTERTLYTDKMVFAEMLYDSGNIEYINYQVYLQLFDTSSEEVPLNKVVYIKTIPETCYSRILKRSREGESNISLEYLTNSSKYHDVMLEKFIDESICREQLILDGNIDIYENKDQVDKWICEIDTFINK